MPADQKLAISAHRPNNLPFLTEALLKISAFKSILDGGKTDTLQFSNSGWRQSLFDEGKQLDETFNFSLLGADFVNGFIGILSTDSSLFR